MHSIPEYIPYYGKDLVAVCLAHLLTVVTCTPTHFSLYFYHLGVLFRELYETNALCYVCGDNCSLYCIEGLPLRTYTIINMSSKYPYLLTPLSRVLENLTGFQLVKKFPAFYRTRRFITAITSARHLSLS